MPVPSGTETTTFSVCAAPNRYSAHAAAFASFSTNTGWVIRPARAGRSGSLCQGRWGGAEWRVAPGEVRRQHHRRPVVGDPAGGTDPDRGHVVPDAERLDDLHDRRLGLRDIAPWGVAALAVDHPAGLVHHAGRDLRAADVDPDRERHACDS